MQTFTRTIAAGGCFMEVTAGKVLSVKNTTLPVVGSFNGGAPFTVLAGTPYDNGAEFRSVNFVNPQAVSVTITYCIGDTAVIFAPQDNQVRVATTYAKGSLYSTDSPGTIATGNNGHQRKQIVFSMVGTGSVHIKDLAGVTFMDLTAATPLTLETDAGFKFAFAGTVTALYVGEIYYSGS